MESLRLEELIGQVKYELSETMRRKKSGDPWFRLKKVQLTVAVSATKDASGQVSLSVISAGGKIARAATHTVTLDMDVLGPGAAIAKTIADRTPDLLFAPAGKGGTPGLDFALLRTPALRAGGGKVLLGKPRTYVGTDNLLAMIKKQRGASIKKTALLDALKHRDR